MQSTRVREPHFDDEIEVTSMDNDGEVLKEAGVVFALSAVYMFCVSVLRTLAIRNFWNAAVPRMFGYREISRKEAGALRALAGALTYKGALNSYQSDSGNNRTKTTLASSKLAGSLITGILVESIVFVSSVFSVRRARRALPTTTDK